jgi:hypothetical protein
VPSSVDSHGNKNVAVEGMTGIEPA